MNFASHSTLKDEMSQDICPWLFQHRHFEKPLVFFLLCQLNTNLQKSQNSNQKSQNCQRFNINVTTLRQWFYKLSVQNGTRTASIVW